MQDSAKWVFAILTTAPGTGVHWFPTLALRLRSPGSLSATLSCASPDVGLFLLMLHVGKDVLVS